MIINNIKKQHLITTISESSFNRTVNEYLENGWLVVPGTLTVSVSVGGPNTHTAERWGVVVEAEIEE